MKKVLLTLVLAIASIGALFAQDTIKLNEAVITATRASKKTPVAQTTVSKEQIKQANIGVDVPYIMELSPSVVSTSESGIGTGNTSFRIRGTDAGRTNVTVDGIPVNDAESQAVFWANMPDLASSVNSIQIQRGVGTSTNGGASFGATVNMQTIRPSAKPYAEVSSAVGMYNTYRNNVSVGTGVIGNGFTFDARYSNVQSDGYIERSSTNHQSLYSAAAWQGYKTFIKFSILHGEQHTGLSWNGVSGYAIDSVKYAYYQAGVWNYKPDINRRYNPAGEYLDVNGKICYYDKQTDNYKQTHYHLQFSQQLAKGWTGHATLHLTRGLGYYEEYKLDRKLVEYGMPNIEVDGNTIKKSDLVRQKWMDNYFYGLTFSANYTSDNLQWIIGGAASRHDGNHYGKVLWAKYSLGGYDFNKPWYENNGTKDDYSIYTKATWQVNKLISLYADLQYRHINYTMEGNDDDLAGLDQSHYFNFFNPKAGAFFNINDKNTAYVSFAIGNREPSRSDFKDASKGSAAEAPLPERMYDFEVSYQYIGNNANAGVNLYYMHYKDQLVLTGKLSSVGYALMDNVDKSYRAGIELMGGIQIAKPLRFEANVTLSRNKIKDFVSYTDVFNDDWKVIGQDVKNLGETNISFSPEITGSAMLRYTPIKNISFLLTGKYVGEQYYDNTASNNRKLEAYFVSNFKIDYSFKLWGVGFGLQGLINNVFNKNYITSAWVYRATFQSSGEEYTENGFFPQAGRNVMAKLTISF